MVLAMPQEWLEKSLISWIYENIFFWLREEYYRMNSVWDLELFKGDFGKIAGIESTELKFYNPDNGELMAAFEDEKYLKLK